MGANRRTSCTLNGAIVTFDEDAQLVVGRQEFTSAAELEDLRAKHRETHLLKRHGNEVLSVALGDGSPPIAGANSVQERAQDQPHLVAALVLDSLLRHFHSLQRTLSGHKPLRLLSSNPNDQLLRTAASACREQLPDWLEASTAFRFDTRVLYRNDGARLVLLAAEARAATAISASCATLLQNNVDVTGLYVQLPVHGDDPRLAPRHQLVGCVSRVDGDELVLRDHADGHAVVRADEAYLEPVLRNLQHCVRQLAPSTGEGILDRLDSLVADVNSGPGRLRRIRSMFDYLRRNPLELAPGITFGLTELLNSGAASPDYS